MKPHQFDMARRRAIALLPERSLENSAGGMTPIAVRTSFISPINTRRPAIEHGGDIAAARRRRGSPEVIV
jgi:hypothetical protein